MLKWSVVFFIVAIAAALFGFTTIAGASFAIAKILFFIFLVLFIITMVMALMAGKSIKNTLES